MGWFNRDSLNSWKAAEEREVTRPRDRRTKFCLDNIGKKIVVKYYGRPRKIKPIRVYTKPLYRKTYVEAWDGWRRKTFDIDDISLTEGKKRSRVMALTQCPDCGKEVSDQAPTCPGCGRPIAMKSGPFGGLDKGVTTRPDFWHDRNVGCVAAAIILLIFLFLIKSCC